MHFSLERLTWDQILHCLGTTAWGRAWPLTEGIAQGAHSMTGGEVTSARTSGDVQQISGSTTAQPLHRPDLFLHFRAALPHCAVAAAPPSAESHLCQEVDISSSLLACQ